MSTAPGHDLIIIGGGLIGLTLATAAAGAGVRTLLVEVRPLEDRVAAGFDGRVTAVGPASRRLLEGIGVWGEVESVAQPILDIEVREGDSPLGVHYDHRDLGHEPLGHIVENRVLNGALVRRARSLEGDRLRIAAPDRLRGLGLRSGRVEVRLAHAGSHHGTLLAACDGKNSPTRAAAGIRARTSPYRQTGLVATIGHSRPHGGLAVEHFFPTGPFAVLPMTGNRSSIVWAVEDRLARELIALPDDAFLDEVADRFPPRLGALELQGPRFHYPLALVQAERVTGPRLALVGDAARAIHPIAGQGWNLGLRDVAALAETVVDARRLGLDPGGADVLVRYERWRRFDGLALAGITDGLNRLFANDLLPLRLARELGLGLVDRTPPLKRFFMRHAAGLLGDLPRLMRGEAL
jgi:2-octaprenyl-6-methoxyphenol hydroxylase